jgi:hypothetical protein
MQTLLVGGHGTGKTTLIVKGIIPRLKSYLVLDFCNEYFQLIKDKSKLKTFESGLMGEKLKEQTINVIRNTKNDTTLIIDNATLLYFPKAIYEKDDGFLWLKEELKDKSYILVFQSIESIINGGIPNIFDEIYCFPTKDDADLSVKYLSSQMTQGKKIITINGFNH